MQALRLTVESEKALSMRDSIRESFRSSMRESSLRDSSLRESYMGVGGGGGGFMGYGDRNR